MWRPSVKRMWMIGGGVVVLVALLASAAFIGGQLLTARGQGLPTPVASGGNQHVVAVGRLLPAKELPQTAADARGLFDHRKDNSIFIDTGNTNITVSGGQVTTSTGHTGPIVEVVVSPRIPVYHDVTDKQFDNQRTGDGSVQQVLEPGSLDEIQQYSLITVWGARTGDRISAEVVVYALP